MFPFVFFATFVCTPFNLGRHLTKTNKRIFFAKAFNTVDHVILYKKVRWCSVTGQLIDWFPNYQDHRELWLTAQPQSVYWSLPVYPRAVMLAHFSWCNSSMTFLMLPSIKRAPPHMSMIPPILKMKDCDILGQDLTSLNTRSYETNMKFRVRVQSVNSHMKENYRNSWLSPQRCKLTTCSGGNRSYHF